MTQEKFIQKIKDDDKFAEEWEISGTSMACSGENGRLPTGER